MPRSSLVETALLHLRLTVFGAVVTIAAAVGALVLTAFPATDGVATPLWLADGAFYELQVLTELMVGAFAVVLTSLTATVAEVLRSLPPEVVAEILDDPADGGDGREPIATSRPEDETRPG